MNELFDKLIIRIIFSLFICLVLFAYKHAHRVLYPSLRAQMMRRFYPEKNSCDSIHFFSRLMGIGIIYSKFHFSLDNGVLMALLDFVLQSSVAFVLYLLSLFIIESIVLYNFEYSDEVVKNKNMAYSIICATHSIAIAFVINTVLHVSGDSFIMLIFIWLLCMALLGLSTKTYSLLSNIPFNRTVAQKNTAVAFSYMGLFWGWCLMVSSSLDHTFVDIKNYVISVVLKVLLALIILPIFRKGMILAFNITEPKNFTDDNADIPTLGHGIFEGVLFITACLFTSIITGQIHFGSFYPVF